MSRDDNSHPANKQAIRALLPLQAYELFRVRGKHVIWSKSGNRYHRIPKAKGHFRCKEMNGSARRFPPVLVILMFRSPGQISICN